MTKSGQCNIRHDAKEKTKRFLQDFFTTMVDMQWTWSFGIFLSFYAITWIVFSGIYWCVAHFRGDLEFYIAVKEIRNQSTIDVVTLSSIMESFGVDELVDNFKIKKELAHAIVEKRDSLCFIGVERDLGFE